MIKSIWVYCHSPIKEQAVPTKPRVQRVADGLSVTAVYTHQRAAPGRKDGAEAGEDNPRLQESLWACRPRAAAAELPAHAAQQHGGGPAEVELRFAPGHAGRGTPPVGRVQGPQGARFLPQLRGESCSETTAALELAPGQGGLESPFSPGGTD